MANFVDSNELFSKCMTESVNERLTARTVASYIESPFEIHCNKFAPEHEKDEITEYQKLLFQRGKDHETQTVHQRYPDITKLTYTNPEEGFKIVLESMVSGTELFHGIPIYYLPEGLYGSADIIEKSNDADSIFGNYHYAIKEVKLAKNIKEKHRLQGAFYTLMLGQIQGRIPKTFTIINGEGEESIHEYSDHESLLLDAIDGTRRILQGESISPTHGGCDFPWESYSNKMAIETNDISLVAGISSKTKIKFIENNYKTVEDLAQAKISDLTQMNGVGNVSAVKYVNNAKAIQSKTHIVYDADSIDFPKRKMEIFLDLEGIDPTMAVGEVPLIDYMIGILVRDESGEKYIAFTAKDTDKEREMLLEFLEFITEQHDYVIYHYHNYEKSHLSKMMEKYEIDRDTQNKVLDHLIDIHTVATKAVYFPTYGNGLKQIAPYLGFKWTHKDVSATESISIYLDFVKNPEENKERFQKVIDYNEDDCVATRVIKDWLVDIK